MGFLVIRNKTFQLLKIKWQLVTKWVHCKSRIFKFSIWNLTRWFVYRILPELRKCVIWPPENLGQRQLYNGVRYRDWWFTKLYLFCCFWFKIHFYLKYKQHIFFRFWTFIFLSGIAQQILRLVTFVNSGFC